MQQSDITRQLDYLEFTREDAEMLRSLKQWAASIADDLVHQFYEPQFNYRPFVEVVERAGSNRQRMEVTQKRYFLSWFDGMPDSRYVEDRTVVGALHARIGVTPELYLSAYQIYRKLLIPRMRQHFRFKPGSADRAIEAITKLITFDQILVMDTYVDGLVSEMQHVINQVSEAASETSATADGIVRHTTATAAQIDRDVSDAVLRAQDGESRAQHVSENVRELATVVEHIARGAQSQARSVTDASQTVMTLSERVAQVASAVQNVSTAAGDARDAAASGAKAVRGTVEGIERISSFALQAHAQVNELTSLSDGIARVIRTIEDITEKTNLLALNAAIEAARAGDAGKGFAVVADGVRQLAESSRAETQVIVDLVQSIQSATAAVVQIVTTVAAEARAGNALAETTAASLDEIVERVATAAERAGEIAVNAQQMMTESHRVVDEMTSIAAIVEEYTAATEEMSATTGSVSTDVRALASQVADNRAASERVQVEVAGLHDQVRVELHGLVERIDGLVTTLETGVADLTQTSPPTTVVPRRRVSDWERRQSAAQSSTPPRAGSRTRTSA